MKNVLLSFNQSFALSQYLKRQLLDQSQYTIILRQIEKEIEHRKATILNLSTDTNMNQFIQIIIVFINYSQFNQDPQIINSLIPQQFLDNFSKLLHIFKNKQLLPKLKHLVTKFDIIYCQNNLNLTQILLKSFIKQDFLKIISNFRINQSSFISSYCFKNNEFTISKPILHQIYNLLSPFLQNFVTLEDLHLIAQYERTGNLFLLTQVSHYTINQNSINLDNYSPFDLILIIIIFREKLDTHFYTQIIKIYDTLSPNIQKLLKINKKHSHILILKQKQHFSNLIPITLIQQKIPTFCTQLTNGYVLDQVVTAQIGPQKISILLSKLLEIYEFSVQKPEILKKSLVVRKLKVGGKQSISELQGLGIEGLEGVIGELVRAEVVEFDGEFYWV